MLKIFCCRFSKGHVAFLRLNEAITRADLRQAISKHLPYAVISSSQAAAARLWLPRTEDTCLSATFIKLRQLAEELKITDYTLTQSSLDQVGSITVTNFLPRNYMQITYVPLHVQSSIIPQNHDSPNFKRNKLNAFDLYIYFYIYFNGGNEFFYILKFICIDYTCLLVNSFYMLSFFVK